MPFFLSENSRRNLSKVKAMTQRWFCFALPALTLQFSDPPHSPVNGMLIPSPLANSLHQTIVMVSIAIRYFAHARREHEANVVQSAGIQDINITMQFSDLLLSRTPYLGSVPDRPFGFSTCRSSA